MLYVIPFTNIVKAVLIFLYRRDLIIMKKSEKVKVKRLIELYVEITKAECDGNAYEFNKDFFSRTYAEIDNIENDLGIYGKAIKSDKELIQEKITQIQKYILKAQKEHDTDGVENADNVLDCLLYEYERADS